MLKYCCLWLNPNKQKRVNRGATLSGILESLEVKEIQSSCELTDGFHLNKAKVKFLQVENERKQIYADILATQIQQALSYQIKSKILLLDSENALEQTQVDLEVKRANYSEAKSNRDDENAIIEQVIIVLKKQVAFWSGS